MTKWLHVQPNTYKLFFSSYDGNHTDIYQMYHCFSMKYNDILRIFHVYAYYELETYYSVWLVICSIAISPHKMALFMVETMEKNKQKHVSREKNQSCSWQNKTNQSNDWSWNFWGIYKEYILVILVFLFDYNMAQPIVRWFHPSWVSKLAIAWILGRDIPHLRRFTRSVRPLNYP